ncbi:MAG TPA: hypothetical protein VFJ57_06695 [Solirubrobacterales bacterium]|nr:hypothetical protein [Solirubrobacterales bacterium]
MKILKRHLTVANVLSCTALFVALAGTAYAATKLGPGQVRTVNIASQAVTNSKIKTQAVTSGKIKNLGINAADLGKESVVNSKLAKKVVTNAKLGTEAVSTGKLAKKSVTANILGPEAVSAGKLGNESVSALKLTGTFYHQLLKNVTYVTETSVNDSETEKSVTALCPPGRETIAGGAKINSPTSVSVAVSGSYPLVAANNGRVGWIATGHETPTEGGNWQVVAYAVCAEL